MSHITYWSSLSVLGAIFSRLANSALESFNLVTPLVHFGRYPPPRATTTAAKLRERFKIDGLVALSGPVAEARFSRVPIDEILARNAAGDRYQARYAASAYALARWKWDADARRQVFADWLIETENLVSENLATIMALAKVLSLNGTLAACDVARIIMLEDRQAAA